jgi:hypothetical protein
VASLALRMHPETTHCQPLKLARPTPSLDADCVWDWHFPRTRVDRLVARHTCCHAMVASPWAGE